MSKLLKHSKMSDADFIRIATCFAMDISASQAARHIGMSLRSVNQNYINIRKFVIGRLFRYAGHLWVWHEILPSLPSDDDEATSLKVKSLILLAITTCSQEFISRVEKRGIRPKDYIIHLLELLYRKVTVEVLEGLDKNIGEIEVYLDALEALSGGNFSKFRLILRNLECFEFEGTKRTSEDIVYEIINMSSHDENFFHLTSRFII